MSSDGRLRVPAPEGPNLVLLAMLLREVDRFPERVATIRHDRGGVLPAAVEVVQALGRAQGAALYVVHDDCPVLAACTVDACRLVHVFETCQGVLQSGRQTSGPVEGVHVEHTTRLTFAAIPLVRQDRVVGVLYLDGLAEMSRRVEALVQRCAQAIAGMLEPPPWPGTDVEPEAVSQQDELEGPDR